MASTIRVVSGSHPLNDQIRTPTENEIRRRTIHILGFSLDLFLSSGISYENYDIIVRGESLKFFGLPLPITVTTVTYREISVTDRALTFDEASELARLDAERQAAHLGDSIIRLISSRESISSGIYTVELTYESIENIALQREIETDFNINPRPSAPAGIQTQTQTETGVTVFHDRVVLTQ
jgi:hypothetical protein